MAVVSVKNVSIRYKTGNFKEIGLKDYVMRRITGNYQVNEFWADRDISFSLDKGDMLGIIGMNGAGKSTLLKAISGIMRPTQGTVKVKGKIAALLELGAGFDGELTVKENTFLRGAMLGYTRQFMNDRYDEIIGFAELEEFQDRPFKQLSSGMKSRLAFSIACLVDPDVLILDEVLSVGDGSFKQKSGAKMAQVLEGGVTGILVSHSLGQVREMCSKILWLDHGRQVAFGGDVQTLCDAYEEFLVTKALPENEGDIEALAEAFLVRQEREAEKKRKKQVDRARKLLMSDESKMIDEAVALLKKKRPELLASKPAAKAKPKK